MSAAAAVLADSDLLTHIFSCTDSITALGRAAQCSRSWRVLSRSNQVWRHVVHTAFPATRGLSNVHSYKDLHARLVGFDPTRRVTALDDYQFMIVLHYEGKPVLEATVPGSAAEMEEPDEEDAELREMYIHGESYDVPLWNLAADVDTAWLAHTREEPADDEEAAADAFEKLVDDVENFLHASQEDPEEAYKLTLTVTAFRASDQRTAQLLHRCPDAEIVGGAQLIFSSEAQEKVYPGRHRRRTDAFPDFDSDRLCLMGCVMARPHYKPADGAETDAEGEPVHPVGPHPHTP